MIITMVSQFLIFLLFKTRSLNLKKISILLIILIFVNLISIKIDPKNQIKTFRNQIYDFRVKNEDNERKCFKY